jgi:hypothetical protein
MTKARDISKLLSTANGKIAGENLDVSFENITDTGTEGTRVATGTQAQRGTTAGQLRFNTDTGLAEYYTGTGFKTIDAPPTVISLDVTEVDSQAGGNQTIVITGSNFQSGATVTFVGNTGTNFNASTVTVDSDTQITAVAPKASFLNAQEPYGVKVQNASGLSATLASQINVDTSPSWSTASGSLGTVFDGSRATASLSATATDADGDTITYSVLSGSLPAGSSLNSSTGAITGFNAVGSSTTSNFTLRATAGSKTADRAFSITVSPPVTQTYSYTGSEQSLTIPSGLTSVTAYVWGAGGAGGFTDYTTIGLSGGSGGYSQGDIDVSNISTLKLVVGSGGNIESSSSWRTRGGAGGGTTGIFDGSVTHANSILISGSGGGGGSGTGSTGGYGGGANNSGSNGGQDTRPEAGDVFGYGGTTSAGGAGASWSGANAYQVTSAQAGSALTGGDSAMSDDGSGVGSPYLNGGRGGRENDGAFQGGGGGGGYYGGGGAQNGYNGGGGGGSGYADTSIVSNITSTNGSQGSSSSSVNPPQTGSSFYASGIGVGGRAGVGGNGRIVITY